MIEASRVLNLDYGLNEVSQWVLSLQSENIEASLLVPAVRSRHVLAFARERRDRECSDDSSARVRTDACNIEWQRSPCIASDSRLVDLL